MSEVLELSDADFANQMRGLIDEAERALTDKPPAAALAPAEPLPEPPPLENTRPVAMPDMLRPVVQGVAAIGRATGEHTQILGKLEKAVGEAAEAQRNLPQIVTDLRAVIETRNHVSRQMFDALHEELKSYKDGFLLDAVHRPIIRDLITLHDDLTQIHQQMEDALTTLPSAQAPAAGEASQLRLQRLHVHMAHNLDFILEVMARLEVQLLPVGIGKLDKQTQRAVALEPTDDQARDMEIVRSVKRGFLWKDRVVRAEEVVIKKWKEGFVVAQSPATL